jgi:hypothetical protein
LVLLSAYLNFVVGTAFAKRGHIISDASAPIIDGIGSPRSWDIILMHWKECMKKHVNCHYDVPGWESNEIVSPRLIPLPTRVIVVDVDSPRLLETKVALGVYAALSHSWGDIHTIRTTRRNFEDHKQHIPLSPIFGTFIDAIAACSVLKIPYLWIDSLCIIQYDETDPLSTRDDSEREIQQMGKIYAQAALTIAATGASDDPTMGLFRGERHRLRQLVEIPLKYRASDKPGEFIYASIKPKTLAEEVSDSRLYTRGWVLQERVLSPRYLHFGREQWFWQCRESTVAESDGIAVVINSPVNAIGADLGMVQAMRGSSDEFSLWWAQIVETYTQLDFSYVNDRFDALRGLMDKLKKETGRQHAWGSWTESLHLQLMWYPFPEDDEDKVRNAKIGSGSENSLPLVRRPRTWSWLSCQYPVEFLAPTFADYTREIGYPSGTRQHAMFRSGFQNIRKKPTTPGEGRAAHSAFPSGAPRDLWGEDLILEGLLRPVLISPTNSASNITMHRMKKHKKGRIGPIAAMMAQVSYTVYDYHLHVEHSPPCTEIPETEVGNATIDDLPSFLRATSFAQDGEKGLPSDANWPMTIMCFLVSINMVKKDSQLLPAGQGKGTGTETNDRYFSSNVLLLQRIRKDEQKVNMYRRAGIGNVDGKHTGFWDNIERSTILLV